MGGGPAGLSAALRLATLQRERGGAPLTVAVLEKARSSGAHMLSGAVLDPSALNELVPDWQSRGAPVDTAVIADHVYFLTSTRKFRFPITPPPLRNHGHYVVSLNRFVSWFNCHAWHLVNMIAQPHDLFFKNLLQQHRAPSGLSG